MRVTLSQFIEALVQSGLLSAAELAVFQDAVSPAGRPHDAESLARALVQAQKLTEYQARVVLGGRTRGLVLGDYVVLDEIASGGMGEVFKARHRTMDRVVALKVQPTDAMQSPEAVQRFRREVKTAAKLVHPNIVTAYDAGQHEGIHYLVMEYVQGKDLGRILGSQGPLPIRQAIDCAVQAARGLEYAHRQGVVHRDIKPGNLLLDANGTVKILDMGLARVQHVTGPTDATGSEILTETGRVMGTTDYMAPEQAEDTHHVDHRADVYSLGCTLYRLLTGKKPFERKNPFQTLLAHREAPRPAIRSHRSEVPSEVEDVVRKMMATRPEDRYESMTEVIAALETCAVPSGEPSRVAFAAAPAGLAGTSLAEQSDPCAAIDRDEPGPAAGEATSSEAQHRTTRRVLTKSVSLGGRKTLFAWVACGVVGLLIASSLFLAFVRRDDGPSALPSRLEPNGSTPRRQAPQREIAVPPVPRAEKQPQSQPSIDPRLAWAGDPAQSVAYVDPELYRVISQTVRQFPIEWFPRMLYTEVVTTVERGQYGQWTLGGSMTRDGKPCVLTVQAGKWFVKAVPPAEAAERGLSDGGIARNTSHRWELPVRQLATLQDPDLRVVTDQQGAPMLVGRIDSVADRRTPVTFLGLMVQIPVPGQDATRDLQQPIYSNDFSAGGIDVSIPIGAEVDLDYNVRFYLQAFLSQPDARFFRISNELLWMPHRPE